MKKLYVGGFPHCKVLIGKILLQNRFSETSGFN